MQETRGTTQAKEIEAHVRRILSQGLDPQRFAGALARNFGYDPADIQAAIEAVGGQPRKIHPEDLAQERLRQDRREAKLDRDAYLRSEHEEV